MPENFRLDGAELLVVSPTPTWPLDHGNRKRIHAVCRALKDRGAVIHFLYYPSEGDWRLQYPKEAERKMRQQWDYYYRITPSVPLHMSAKGDSHTIDEWWDDAIGNELEWLTERNRFDAMIVNYSWLSKALTFAPKGCLRVLDTHDRFSGRGGLLEANGIEKEFFHTSQKEEFRALERADLVWAIKREEEDFFRKLLETYEHEEPAKPKTVPLPEEEEEEDDYDYAATEVDTLLFVEEREGFEFRLPSKRNGYLTVGIVGAYNNINLVNTRAFLDAALPVFEKYTAPVRVLIAGSMCRGLQDIRHPFVEQLGRVESLDDFYGRLDIALVPMTFSTGLKIKAGEALGYGVPLIAHEHAFEGYPVRHEMQVMESLEAIAEAVVDAAYESSIVEALHAASLASQQALRDEVEATIDRFVMKLRGHRKTAMVILPEVRAGEYSLRKLHIGEAVDTLKDAYRIVFHYPYALTRDAEVYLEECGGNGIVACADSRGAEHLFYSGVTPEETANVWSPELVWNLSDVVPDAAAFDGRVDFFCDRSFARASGMPDVCGSSCDVAVETIVPSGYGDAGCVRWYSAPFTGRIDAIYRDMWRETDGASSRAVYLLMSGTKEQMRFWHRVYTEMLGERYRLYWIIDSDEVDWPVENRLDAEAVADNFALLKDPARCAIMVNFGRSNLLGSIAWAIYMCKRRIYDTGELPVNENGVVTLFSAFTNMTSFVENLDLNNYSNRFQHLAMTLMLAEVVKLLRKKKTALQISNFQGKR